MTNHFEKYATPISIIIAGLLVGTGILLSKVVSGPSSNTTAPTSNSAEDVLTHITTLPVLKKIGIKSKDLSACITNKSSEAAVANDVQLGQDAGLRGTPHMVVMMKKDGKDIQFQLFGALDKSMIEQAIAEGKTPDAQASYVEKFELQTLRPEDHIKGNVETAKAVLIEYSDIDCPFCKKVHPTLQSLVDNGTIAWVYRHSPIPSLHPNAQVKAVAAECVSQLKGNDAFWQYLDTIVVEQS